MRSLARTLAVVVGPGMIAACAPDRGPLVGSAGDVDVYAPVAMVTAVPDVASVYFTLANRGPQLDTLRALSASVGTATLHTVVAEGGRSRMRRVELLTLPAGGVIQLEPGSYHIMLTNIVTPPVPGDTITLRLSFGMNGPVEFGVPVMSFADGMERFAR